MKRFLHQPINYRLKIFLLYLTFLFPVLLWPETLKVVIINVWSGLDYIGSLKMGEYEDDRTRARRYDLLVRELKEIDADVIALNEANKLPRYARRIARNLDYDKVYHVGVGGVRIGTLGLPVNLREGDVILAKQKHNMKSEGRQQLSGGYVGNLITFHFADATQVVAAKIVVENQNVYLFNTHWHASPFPHKEYLVNEIDDYLTGEINAKKCIQTLSESIGGHEWRMNEARKTLEFIDKIAGDNPVILMGDFNALSNSKEISLLKDAGFVDTYPAVNSNVGYTWDELLNANIQTHYLKGFVDETKCRRDRIDYIFIRGDNLKVLKSEVVFNKPNNGIHPSDHFGVLTEIELISYSKK